MVSPPGPCRSAMAWRAAVTAAREASPRSPPACTAATSTGNAACAATWDASSGRAEEETPSQTTATNRRAVRGLLGGQRHRVLVTVMPEAPVAYAGQRDQGRPRHGLARTGW